MDKSITYSNIPINYDEIEQKDLNIDVKTRSNLFAWNGQFSPQFVEVMLERYATKDDVVIDPFLGSGTVLYECARMGISAYGVELNTAPYYMAKIYELANLEKMEREKLILEIDNIIKNHIKEESFLDNIILFINQIDSKIICNIFHTLIVLLDIQNNEVSKEFFEKKWEMLKDTIINLPYSKKVLAVDKGDSRAIWLEDDFADLLFTSPPYINVFNYHQKYRASVEKLGFDVLSTAKSEFGSNRKNRSNRLLTVVQYCIDMALSLKEASRVCKEKSRMIYVVGRESTVLGYAFCNSELIYIIGTKILGFTFILRQERVFKNRYGQMIYEDILHFSNNKKNNNCEEEIINKAIAIAVEILKSKISIKNKNLVYLMDAIEKADKVKKSEVYDG